ncbi:MAG: hydantoinase/oxoprolinase family protein [Gammaproteobacteria bacterium]
MSTSAPLIVGIDTGGTFTDFVLIEGERLVAHKVLSTPDAPERAILEGLAALGVLGREARIVHGSTVATNAVLEGKGARTAFVTNRGFADLLTIGRQARARPYDLTPPLPPVPVPSELCLETGGRLGADGSVVEPLTDEDLAALRAELVALAPEAVAICLLFAFQDERFEARIEAALADLPAFICRSSEVLPEFREYERGMATWMNAYVGPRMARYLTALESRLAPARLAVMQSAGVSAEPGYAARHAVNLLLSGPAGGLAGARHVGAAAGCERLLTFDMGGTSTDVALIDGELALTSEGRVGPWPVAVPMVDMHSIGAGGGSLARVDQAGMLHVGPQSAGAAPGPACYGLGGEQATVTDANVVLGRLPADLLLGGRIRVDRPRAEAAVGRVAAALGVELLAAAQGIIDLANEHMQQALREISIERGMDPRDYTLVSFGGAGGLHVCALAEALGMARALVPAQAGVLSALGMAVAHPGRQLSRTLRRPLATLDAAAIEAGLAELEARGAAALAAEGHAPETLVRRPSLDVCYSGQAFALTLPWSGDCAALAERFEAEHRRRYGHALERPLEVVNLRLALEAPAARLPALAPVGAGDPRGSAVRRVADLGAGESVAGPAVLVGEGGTAWLAPGWRATADVARNLHLERG